MYEIISQKGLTVWMSGVCKTKKEKEIHKHYSLLDKVVSQ